MKFWLSGELDHRIGDAYRAVRAAFVPGPLSVPKAFCLALAVGGLSPIAKMFLFRWLPWRTVPFVFVVFLALATSLLYWQTDRAGFRIDWRAMLATLGAGLLWAGGAAGSGWCLSAHVCIAGHMDHLPYAVWHYAADGGWAFAVTVATVWMLSVRVSLCLAFAVLSSFLISYRFLFQSLGGMYEVVPL